MATLYFDDKKNGGKESAAKLFAAVDRRHKQFSQDDQEKNTSTKGKEVTNRKRNFERNREEDSNGKRKKPANDEHETSATVAKARIRMRCRQKYHHQQKDLQPKRRRKYLRENHPRTKRLENTYNPMVPSPTAAAVTTIAAA